MSCVTAGVVATLIEPGLWGVVGAPLQNRVPLSAGGPNLIHNGVSGVVLSASQSVSLLFANLG